MELDETLSPCLGDSRVMLICLMMRAEGFLVDGREDVPGDVHHHLGLYVLDSLKA